MDLPARCNQYSVFSYCEHLSRDELKYNITLIPGFCNHLITGLVQRRWVLEIAPDPLLIIMVIKIQIPSFDT